MALQCFVVNFLFHYSIKCRLDQESFRSSVVLSTVGSRGQISQTLICLLVPAWQTRIGDTSIKREQTETPKNSNSFSFLKSV